MTDDAPLEIFLSALPGLERHVLAEAQALGFDGAASVPGGVVLRGGWPEVWRANLALRTASRVLARIGAFRAMHLAQLDKRARRFAWGDVLRSDVAVKVEATCKASRIYHAGAAAERIERALREEAGITIAADAPLRLIARIEDDLVSLSLDTSGEPLHRRGHKQAVGKAPLRETMAAAFLADMGYDGTQPVVDPMCGSGTFVIEAAEIAAGLAPGRGRSFAFEQLASLDPDAWQAMRAKPVPTVPTQALLGADRDDGAIRMSTQNAERAGVDGITTFLRQPISDLTPPDGPPGLVMVNPPYGARIGNKKPLYALYGTLGTVLKDRFAGWRVGLVTSEPGLAHATALPFGPDPLAVSHGGMRVRFYRTGPLGG